MNKFFLFAVVVAIIAASFTFWTRVLDGRIPSWGYLYESTTEERQLAEDIARETVSWRKDRVLPDFRTDETLCPYALRRARQIVANPDEQDGLQKMIGENTLSLQTSYVRVAELTGTSTSALDLIQRWSESEQDREILQDKKLTHHCVRCSTTTCVQLLIETKTN